MKLNLYNVFDDLPQENAQKINQNNASFNCDAEITDIIKDKTLSRLELAADNKRKSIVKKKLSFKRIAALAAAFVIICGSISVGATAYFKPDSALAQYFTFDNEVDMSTLGQDVNIAESSGGYTIMLKQVLSDNSIIHAVFECPESNGMLLVPSVSDLKINGRSYFDSYATSMYIEDNSHTCSVIIHGLRNIKNNDSITLIADGANFYDLQSKELLRDKTVDGSWNFTFEALRADVKTKLDPSGNIKTEYCEYEVINLTLSPLGVHIDYRQISPVSRDPETNTRNDDISLSYGKEDMITLELKNGEIYTDSDSSCFDIAVGGTATEDDPYEGNIDIMFKNVINTDEIKSISVCGCVVYEAE